MKIKDTQYNPDNYYWKRLEEIDQNCISSDKLIKTYSYQLSLASTYLVKKIDRILNKFDEASLHALGLDNSLITPLKEIEASSKVLFKAVEEISNLINLIHTYSTSYHKEDFDLTRYNAITTINAKMSNLSMKAMKQEYAQICKNTEIIDNKINKDIKQLSKKLFNVYDCFDLYLGKVKVFAPLLMQKVDSLTQDLVYPNITLSEEFNIFPRHSVTSLLGIDLLSVEEQKEIKK